MKAIISESEIRRAVRRVLLEARTDLNFLSSLTTDNLKTTDNIDAKRLLNLMFFDDDEPDFSPTPEEAASRTIDGNEPYYSDVLANLDAGEIEGAQISDLYVRYLTKKFGGSFKITGKSPIPIPDFVGSIDDFLVHFSYPLTIANLITFTHRLLNRMPLANPDAAPAKASDKAAPDDKSFTYFTEEQTGSEGFRPDISTPAGAISVAQMADLLEVSEVGSQWQIESLQKYEKEVLGDVVNKVEEIVYAMTYTGIPIDLMITGDDFTSGELNTVADALVELYNKKITPAMGASYDRQTSTRAVVDAVNEIYNYGSSGTATGLTRLTSEVLISLALGSVLGVLFSESRILNYGKKFKSDLELRKESIDKQLKVIRDNLEGLKGTEFAIDYTRILGDWENLTKELESAKGDLAAAERALEDFRNREYESLSVDSIRAKVTAHETAAAAYQREKSSYDAALDAYDKVSKGLMKSGKPASQLDVYANMNAEQVRVLTRGEPVPPPGMLPPTVLSAYQDVIGVESGLKTREREARSAYARFDPAKAADLDAKMNKIILPDGTPVGVALKRLKGEADSLAADLAQVSSDIPNQWKLLGSKFGEKFEELRAIYSIRNWAGQLGAYYFTIALAGGMIKVMTDWYKACGPNEQVIIDKLASNYDAFITGGPSQRGMLPTSENSLAFLARAYEKDPIELSRTFSTGLDSEPSKTLAGKIANFAEKAIAGTVSQGDAAAITAARQKT